MDNLRIRKARKKKDKKFTRNEVLGGVSKHQQQIIQFTDIQISMCFIPLHHRDLELITFE